jgi:hypothetical protein
MKLPVNFSFSQQNLQDFQDCPHRFFLRYILKQEWPAIESEPVKEQEELIILGEKFHRLVQQFFAGVPQLLLESSISDPTLMNWWQQFIRLDILSLPGTKLSEALFSIPFEGFRLIAKYDLLVLAQNGPALIYDWKTSQHTPRRKWLQDRMQTKVYPLVLSSLSKTGEIPYSISKESIEMTYWYPAFPESPVTFVYSESQFENDKQFLCSSVQEILLLEENGFLKTEDEKACRFCRYRSLCERGIEAGIHSEVDSTDSEIDSAFDIDFDQISAAD